MDQNIRLCLLSLRAIPGMPWVEVFKLKSQIMESFRSRFELDCAPCLFIEQTAISYPDTLTEFKC